MPDKSTFRTNFYIPRLKSAPFWIVIQKYLLFFQKSHWQLQKYLLIYRTCHGHNTGDWSNGMTEVSKTFSGSSILSSPVMKTERSQKTFRFFCIFLTLFFVWLPVCAFLWANMQWISQDRSTQKNDLTSMIEIWNEVVEDGVISNIHARHLCERLGFVQPGVLVSALFFGFPQKQNRKYCARHWRLLPEVLPAGLSQNLQSQGKRQVRCSAFRLQLQSQ